LKAAARRRVAFHLKRQRTEQPRAAARNPARRIHDDVMSNKGPHFIAAKT
jgi:hypothetical protein